MSAAKTDSPPPDAAANRARGLPAAIGWYVALAVGALLLFTAVRVRELTSLAQELRTREVTVRAGDWLAPQALPVLTGDSVVFIAPLAEVASDQSTMDATPVGALTLVFAFAPDCPHCNALAPTWQRAASQIAVDGGVAVLGIATSKDTAGVRSFLARHAVPDLTVGLAATPRQQRTLAIRAVPQTFLADGAGRVWWSARNVADVAMLSDSLSGLLQRWRSSPADARGSVPTAGLPQSLR